MSIKFEKHLDGIRGIAIILVLIQHTVYRSLEVFKFDVGKMGVFLFFTLSGYLMVKTYSSYENTSLFLKKRVNRVFPLFFSYILIIALFTLSWDQHFSYAMLFLENFHMASTQKFSFEVGHTWTLALEIQFYLLFPFLYYLLKKKPIALYILALTLIFITAYFLNQISLWAYAYPWFSGFCFIAGMILTKFSINRFIYLIIFSLFYFTDLLPPEIFYSFFALFLIQSPKNFILNFKPLTAIGKASYSMYLFHLALLKQFHFVNPLSSLQLQLLNTLTIVVVSFLLAQLTKRTIERYKPFKL